MMPAPSSKTRCQNRWSHSSEWPVSRHARIPWCSSASSRVWTSLHAASMSLYPERLAHDCGPFIGRETTPKRFQTAGNIMKQVLT
eukprot:1610850-Amphidinium_carterae.1